LPDQVFAVKHQAQYWNDVVGVLGAHNAPRARQRFISVAVVFVVSWLMPYVALSPFSGFADAVELWWRDAGNEPVRLPPYPSQAGDFLPSALLYAALTGALLALVYVAYSALVRPRKRKNG
jgi:hypothetical protein